MTQKLIFERFDTVNKKYRKRLSKVAALKPNQVPLSFFINIVCDNVWC